MTTMDDARLLLTFADNATDVIDDVIDDDYDDDDVFDDQTVPMARQLQSTLQLVRSKRVAGQLSLLISPGLEMNTGQVR